jgi:glutathione S-transferase
MSAVEIIGIPQSNYVRVIRMVCEEKGIDYSLTAVPPHSAEVTAIHPLGKIPAMRHGDIELFESKAIATYLDRVFDGPKLIPEQPVLAAAVEQWVSLVNTVVDRTMIRSYLFGYVFPKTADGKPDRLMIDGAVPELQRQMSILDRAVAGTGHLAGSALTLADLNLMPILFYAKQFPEGSEALAANRHLSAYFDRHAARPSFINTMPPPPPGRGDRPN